MKRVLGLGNALVDLLIQMNDDTLIEKLNLPKGSMTLIDANQSAKISSLIENMEVGKVSGGSAANTIYGIARLGVSCGFIGKVNDDDIGNFFREDLIHAGIDARLLKGNTSSGRAYTFISADGERTFATYLGAAVEMSAEELSDEAFRNYDVFHIEGYLVYNKDLIEQALKIAKRNNLLVSIDMASYNVVQDNLDFLKEMLPKYVDIVFANEEEAKAYTGKEPNEALIEFAQQCDIAVVKVGGEGSLIRHNDFNCVVPVEKIIPTDTTGAGDSYAAGFLYGLNLDLPLKKCGELGTLLAGQVIRQYGARIAEEQWGTIIEKAGKIAG